MQKRTREIIALILLLAFGIGGACAFAWYILVGHNWNATATRIDEHIGSMDGYTVILCEGSVPTLGSQREASISQPMLEEQNFGEYPESALKGDDEAAASMVDAVASYIDKGAQVVRVNLDDFAFYDDPIIVPRNGRRIAIFSVSGPMADTAAKVKVKQLERSNVDFTICVVDNQEAVERGLGDVDLAICTDFDGAGEEGRYIGQTYVMGSPYRGDVGAVFLAPSGYLSTKTVEDV